jgi:ABC-type antimicrobial peptide transport system permease subunit
VIAALTLALTLIFILPPSINTRQAITQDMLDSLLSNADFLKNKVTLSATEVECGYPTSLALFTHGNGSIILRMQQELLNSSLSVNITSIPDVVDVVPIRLDWGTEDRPYNIYGVAVDNNAFQKDPVLLPTNISQGRTLQLGDRGVVVLDELTAANLTVGVGDVVMISSHPLTVIGIEGITSMWLSVGEVRERATMSLDDACIITNSSGQVSSFRVFVNDVDNVNAVVARIKNLDSGLEVSSGVIQLNAVQPLQDQIAALTLTAQNNLNQVQSIGMVEIGVGLVAAVAVILFMMLYSVRERTKEIGTLKAMGASTSKVLGQFMFEGVLLSIVAAVLAITISIFILPQLASLILPVPVQEGVNVGTDANGTLTLFRITSGSLPPFLPGKAHVVIGASLGVEWLVVGFGLAVLLGALGSLYPALKAARTKPAEAMRYE